MRSGCGSYPTISTPAKKKAISVAAFRQTVHGAASISSELRTDRAGGGLLRIGGAHHLTVARDGVIAFQPCTTTGAEIIKSTRPR